jgi:hypothetical protein
MQDGPDGDYANKMYLVPPEVHVRVTIGDGTAFDIYGRLLPGKKLLSEGGRGFDLVDIERGFKSACEHEAFMSHRILELEAEVARLRVQADKPTIV